MNIFEHNNKKYFSINGKDYFLIRGYEKNYRKLIFMQVAGSTPLRKEDMPNKEWEILKTKSCKRNVWTAYVNKYFKYNTERENSCLGFLGATTHASYFIALKFIAMKFNLKIEDEEVMKKADDYSKNKKYGYEIKEIDDSGNSGQSLVMVDIGSLDEIRAKSIFEGGE